MMGKSLEKSLSKEHIQILIITWEDSLKHYQWNRSTAIRWYYGNPEIMATKLETTEDMEQLKLSEIFDKEYMLIVHFEKSYGEYLL